MNVFKMEKRHDDHENEIAEISRQSSKHDQNEGIKLIPQPTNDPADPLNWSTPKKLLTLFIVTLAGFIGLTQTVAANSGYFVQAELYGKTAVQLSYGTSSGIVGLAVGPLVWAPIAQRVGRTSCIFWGMLGTLVCGTWSAVMTHRGDYNDYVVSRFFAALFGSVASALGAGTIVDIFFLHQRGKAFMFYLATLNFGTVLSPTVGGYIVGNVEWPVQIWWTVGVECLAAILTLLFLEETGFPRENGHSADLPTQSVSDRPRSYLSNRVATFLPGTKIVPRSDGARHSSFTSIQIGLCPLTLLAGLLLTVDFGWLVAQNTLIAVFLQNPLSKGGYGFTPSQNASFNFSQWIGIILAIAYGFFVSDRLPIWICYRSGGSKWRLEYRLYPALLPGIVLLPAALGLFGSCLQYHLHYIVLALASLLVNLSVNAVTSVVTNYVAESFTGFASETATILNFYRLLLGLLVPFFVDPWEQRVTVGWMFGMMAFFSLACSAILVLFIWYGPAIRDFSPKTSKGKEEGLALKKERSADG